jgi:hypothetical protein
MREEALMAPMCAEGCDDADLDPNDAEGRQESSDLLSIDHQGQEYTDEEGSNKEANCTEKVLL